ncbi:ras-related protein Rab-26-like [Betta splendens]|uniref:small monomeric GTPase n=1 Tax=Betta splendens TaxID=158456 RepID=A0A6P7L3N1_BETSP|nr:ras-related protein Rab-26-like [Betta splendens]
MSRKKAAKAKSNAKSPKASPSGGSGRSGKGLAAAAAASSGLVYPSRPSISNSGEFYDLSFKVMLVGDSGVGKTCLLVRFKDGAFLAGSFISTVGIDFRNKVMSIDAVKVKLQIWDTAGQERFRSVTHAYYRDAHALLLLYDVTNKASFDNIRAWLTEVHEYAQQDVVVMLLGNKADSTHNRLVKREEGEKLAKEFGVPFMETSAKSGLNVELAFTAVAKELKHRTMKEPDEPKFQLQEYVDKEMRTAACCGS